MTRFDPFAVHFWRNPRADLCTQIITLANNLDKFSNFFQIYIPETNSVFKILVKQGICVIWVDIHIHQEFFVTAHIPTHLKRPHGNMTDCDAVISIFVKILCLFAQSYLSFFDIWVRINCVFEIIKSLLCQRMFNHVKVITSFFPANFIFINK